MRGLVKLVIVLGSIVLAPAAAFAQGSIVGVVKDTSGAVLPGVTVEASSPALIEKARTGITDGTGQYRIESLPPGAYTVTYTLTGFNTVKREGIQLTGSFTATVNAELRVGALEETITVTGETPVVDVQSTTRQRVLDRQVLDSIPAGRNEYNVGVLIPGVTLSGGQDVGGAGGTGSVTNLGVHGSKASDTGLTMNGVTMSTLGAAGSHQIMKMNAGATQEVTLDTAAVSADQAVGGVRLNLIPREGGNTFNGMFYGAFANSDMQGSNFTQELQDRGLRSPNTINKNWDINPAFGGPIKRDKLWFYVSVMHTGASQYAAGLYHNKNHNNPNAWTFEPDLSRPATNDQEQPDAQARLTWQVTPKHKVGFTWHEATMCFCPQTASTTSAVEREPWREYPLQRIIQVDWTSPITSRLLFEFGGVLNPTMANILAYPGLNPVMIGVTEQSTGLNYRAGDPFRYRTSRVLHLRGAVSYITGAHAFKVGMNHSSGYSIFRAFDNQPLNYRFNNGVPNQLTQRAYPWDSTTNVDHNMGLFAQDKWTGRGLTVGVGVRYDYFANSFPEQHVGPAKLAPARDITFPEQKNLAYHDITPKLGASYDPFGTGKTAIKVSLNKYLVSLGAEDFGGAPNRVNNLVITTTRSWNDLNRNFVPDCDLTNTALNGECGLMGNTNFGKVVPGATYDSDLLRGWGRRNNNWEFSAGIQQELLPRVSADASYFRRSYGNFVVVDDVAVAAAEYTPFSFTAPSDPRLPGGGGYVVSGNYNVVPSKFGIPNDYFVTRAENYGNQIEYWHGVDFTVNARPRAGVLLQGGLSTGRTVTDNCEVVAKVPEASIITIGTNNLTVAASAPNSSFCHQATLFLTQAKFLGSYLIPRVGVQVSGTFQSLPGPQILATFNATNALVAPSLGRPISGNQANVTVNLVEPGTMYGDRLNQLDLRFAKLLRFGRLRTSLNVDLYNALNASPVITQNNNFGAWQQPTGILLARFVKLSAQIDF
jgi:hypothetical protein